VTSRETGTSGHSWAPCRLAREFPMVVLRSLNSLASHRSMPNLPHKFELLRTGNRPTGLIFGAGLSWGLVPGPGELLSARKTTAESMLACSEVVEIPPGAEGLYVWSEKVLEQIRAVDHRPPKLRLAEALGLLDDPRWRAEVGLPLRGSTPRHRVIARLAREDRWTAAWSLNWDCLLESALERVGFDRGEPRAHQPWLTGYTTIVTAEDFERVARRDLFCVLKPHGCIRSMIEAAEAAEQGNAERSAALANRLMITAAELSQERTNEVDRQFFALLRPSLMFNPFIVLGWSVSEPYLKSVINDSLDGIRKNSPEEITIVDIEFNSSGHEVISKCYGLNKNSVYCEVSAATTEVGVDELFLWIQARYCLNQLSIAARHILLDEMTAREKQIEQPSKTHFLLNWADDFVPAWTRLCWRAGLVTCEGFEPHQLAIEREDEHVPWHIRGVPRPDLRAAARLLAAIPIDGGIWDVSKFPGALWDSEHQRLVVPLPTWGDVTDLAALRPLAKTINEGIGYVDTIDVLPLHSETDSERISRSRFEDLRHRLASTINVMQFASGANIGLADDIVLESHPK